MRNNEAQIDDITIGRESMEQIVRPKLEIGHLVPDFRLQTVTGETISPVDFKEKKNLVILFFNPRDRSDWETLAEVRRRYHEFADANAEVLAIGSGPMDELKECVAALDVPFPILGDIRGEATCAYCVYESTIFVADRFGELKLQSSTKDNLDALLDAAVSTLELIELECPECGVSTWPQALD